MTSIPITVGVPVFNEETYLAETLDSILDQDVADYEVVIADNASTDSTPEICADYALRDSRVRWVRAERNAGAARNYNWLVALARGRYFKWASGNDLIAPSLLRLCAEVLDAQDDVVLAYPQTVMIDADGEVLHVHPDRLHMPFDEPWQRLRHFVHHRHHCNPCFGLIRTDVLRATHLVRPGISSDISLLAELAVAGKFHEVDEPLFRRRVLPESCGLGQLTQDEVATWFSADQPVGPRMPVNLRIFLEIEQAILMHDLSILDRVRTAGVFGYEWTKNRMAISMKSRRVTSANGQAGGTESSPTPTAKISN